ncbi:MAG: hypothetical protein U1E43_04540 [Rhodospirillales bacterium]
MRAASNHSGPWPRMQVWHGDADVTVKPLNAGEVVKQWCNVHAITGEPALDEQVGPHRHRVWRDAAGQDIVEHWTVAGLPHGQAIDPQAPDGCGQPEPFIIDAGISSPTHIARSWGRRGGARPPGWAAAAGNPGGAGSRRRRSGPVPHPCRLHPDQEWTAAGRRHS